MRSAYFISDLHLNELRPLGTDLFLKFLTTEAVNVKGIYILGDFFEYWIGDDIASTHDIRVMMALKSYSEQNKFINFIRGNRDFLIGRHFLKKFGCTLLEDEAIVPIGNTQALIMHGDSLCTKDVAYQRFRFFSRLAWTQKIFLLLPQLMRKRIAKTLRQHSFTTQKENLLSDKFDVTSNAVTAILEKYKLNVLIHGHTHVPGIHLHNQQKNQYRIVLGEWKNNQGSYLSFNPEEVFPYQLHTFS